MYPEEFLTKLCTTAPEILVFYVIRDLGGFIFHMEHDMAHGRIPEKDHLAISQDVQKAREESKKIAYTLGRFGVPMPDEGDPVPDGYWKWYEWWNAYDKSLTDEQFQSLDKALESGDDVTKWRPEGDWKVDATESPEVPTE